MPRNNSVNPIDQAIDRRESPQIPRVPMMTGRRYMKRIINERIISKGHSKVESSPWSGKRSSNDVNMPKPHEKTKRPMSITMSVMMNPNLMRCWVFGVWKASNAMLPPNDRPSTNGTENRPNPELPSPVKKSPIGSCWPMRTSMVSKSIV